jgi:tetratricopeptide (TPR) repeat protein
MKSRPARANSRAGSLHVRLRFARRRAQHGVRKPRAPNGPRSLQDLDSTFEGRGVASSPRTSIHARRVHCDTTAPTIAMRPLRFALVLLAAAGSVAGATARPFELVAPQEAPAAAPADEDPKVTRERRVGLSSEIAGKLADAKVDEHRRHLLELAGSIADRIPARPLAKDRALTQQVVVEASLALDQMRFAHERSLAIDNWRRGIAWSHLAYAAAEHDRKDVAIEYARAAAVLADDLEIWLSEYETSQDWRRDRIRGRVGQAYARLGDLDTAAGFVVDAEPSEAGKVAIVVSAHAPLDDYEERLAYMKATLPNVGFDAARDALAAAIELFGRFHGEPERRDAIAAVAREGWSKLPIDVRVWAMAGLAEKCIEHGDAAGALAWIAEARVASAGGNWRPSFRIPVDAQLVGLAHRAGDVERASAEAAALRALYDTQRDNIVNIDRADALVPLAEAHVVMGDFETAKKLYRRAIDEALVNPNSKPRAIDLVDVAVSLATVELPADAELLAHLASAATKLSDPW